MKSFFKQKPKPGEYLPILIVPGFMSSGLEVKQSDLRESWVDKRIWLNLKALGFESFVGPKQQSSATASRTPTNVSVQPQAQDGAATVDATTSLAPKSEAEVEREGAILRNAWLQHMALQDDMVTEREGIQVRPIEGLAGVDYLAPGLFTSHVSYVFGPIIDALLKVGYEKNVNLDAAPYDWRLPPSALETRDRYFTRTMNQIEELFLKNDNTPVALVCHSMGCKVGHYLLNFAKNARGQEWVDRYIHTYIPIGAPHIGAPKAMRSLISGDKMGLDTFLNDREALVMGRSLGSGPFLVPADLPPGACGATFLRMDGAIEVSLVSSVDTNLFLSRREEGSRPDKLKLTVAFGGHNVSTPFYFIDEESQHVQFNETFTFRTEADGPTKRQGLAILLCEPGVHANRYSTTTTRKAHLNCRECFFKPWQVSLCGDDYKWGRPPKDNKVLFWLNILTFWWLIYPLVRYSVELALKLGLGATYGIFFFLCCGTVAGVDELSKASGGSSVLAVAKVRRVRPEIINDELEEDPQKPKETEVELDLVSYRDANRMCCCCRPKRSFTVTVKIKWIPPECTSRPRNTHRQSLCQPDLKTRPLKGYLRSAKKSKKYAVRSGHDILDVEHLSRVVEHMDKDYENDPIDPRGVSSVDPPPVGTIKAIYGTNLPTEVGTVFKRRHAVLGNAEEIDNFLTPDDKVSLEGNDGDHTIKNGVLYELGSETDTAGDGTVPYWSLSYVKKWEQDRQVTVHELEGAEHREILADKRLHEIIIAYCCQKEDCAASTSPSAPPDPKQKDGAAAKRSS